MALECTLVVETSLPVAFTCADANAIPKGSLVKITDPMTVALNAADNDPIVGITAEEKIANDGKTTIAVYREGIFKGYAGAAGVTVGIGIICDAGTGAANELVDADVNSENIVGRSYETATDTQSFMFELKPFNVNLA